MDLDRISAVWKGGNVKANVCIIDDGHESCDRKYNSESYIARAYFPWARNGTFHQSATVAVGVQIYILAYSATLRTIPGLCTATSRVTILFKHVILVPTMIVWWHFVFFVLGVSVLVLGQTSANPSALDLLPACGVRPNHALENSGSNQLIDRREVAWSSHFRCHRVHQTIRHVSAKMSNSRQSWVHVS